jgi:hypothetical protein
MKKILINYANERFKQKQSNNTASALRNGFDTYIDFGPDTIQRSFVINYNHILSQPRGNGFWLWKPLIILDSLLTFEEGDIIMYSDSGATFVNNVQPLFDICEYKDIVLFKLEQLYLSQFCKRDAFVYMQKCDEDFHGKSILNAAFQLYKVSKKSIEFVTEYLTYCTDERILTDIPNTCGLPNYPDFMDHRHDQSVLSILAHQQGIVVHRTPCQYGVGYEDRYNNSEYGQIIDHHR